MSGLPLRLISLRAALAILLGGASHAIAAGPAALAPVRTRTTFAHSIREVPTTPVAVDGTPYRAYISRATLTVEEAATPMDFEIGLRMRNFAELEARLAHSEIIPVAEMQARYYPLAADRDRVAQWLRDEGIEVTRADDSNLGIFARGRASEVARVLQTTLARVTSDSREYTAAIAAPALPEDLAPAVLGVHGLQPYQQLRPQIVLRPQSLVDSQPPYLPSQIATAYNAPALTGAGQTVAILAYCYPAANDLANFWSAVGSSASAVNIDQVNVGDGPPASVPDGYPQEVTMDVEWASALAPGARIRIYGLSRDSGSGEELALQQILADLPSQPGLHQLSISYGIGESTYSGDYLKMAAQTVAALTASGVTVFASSGDYGAYPTSKSNIKEVNIPAGLPDVTGVGGTSLHLTTINHIASELAWGNPFNASFGSSGGGASAVFSRPSWQTGPGVDDGSTRLVPDVAVVGDPYTGGYVYYSGNPTQYGGTSLSAPVWSAWCALLNQARATAGKPPLGALNPRVYPLAGTPAFHDMLGGGNAIYAAAPGYDMITGVGTPDLAALAAALTNDSFVPVLEATSGDRATVAGQTATFFVVANGAPGLTYTWQRSPVQSSVWADLADDATWSGTATNTLSVTHATLAMNGDRFRCVVASLAGSLASDPAKLSVDAQGVATVAGWPDWAGTSDGTGSGARFNFAGCVRAGPSGTLYVADPDNDLVRKISSGGVVTTVAGKAGISGSADGATADARFNHPGGVALDAGGNIYVADSENYTVRKIAPNGTVSTLAGSPGQRGSVDGPGSQARFYSPQNIASDAAGNLYVADGKSGALRKVTPAGAVSTLAGPSAGLRNLLGVATDAQGNVYAADYDGSAIFKITPGGTISRAAAVSGPSGVAVDSVGRIFVTSQKDNAIYWIATNGFVSLLAGSPGKTGSTDGTFTAARFNSPADLTTDPAGNVYIADGDNCTVRILVPGTAISGSAPVITTQPVSQAVSINAQVKFSVAVADAGAVSYEWDILKADSSSGPVWLPVDTDGSSATLTATASFLDSVTSYRCVVRNSWGAATSNTATLTARTLPRFTDTVPDDPQVLIPGNSLTLTAKTSGVDLHYQWQFDGADIPGATQATFQIAHLQNMDAGSYSVVVTNVAGSASQVIKTLVLATSAPSGTWLSNLSVLAPVGGSNGPLTVGFSLAGGAASRILIRGIGPGLRMFQVQDFLFFPNLALAQAGKTLAGNQEWNVPPSVFAAVGAFALQTYSEDTALFMALLPGNYTAQITPEYNYDQGRALAEIYHADTAILPSRLINISALSSIAPGASLTAGFAVSGQGAEKVLIRAVGPGLAQFGLGSLLARPTLTLMNSAGITVATNSSWSGQETAQAMANVGAFALTPGSTDAALLASLSPDTYTAVVTGSGNVGGAVLIEVYEMK